MEDFQQSPAYKKWLASQELKKRRQKHRQDAKRLRGMGWTLDQIGLHLGVTRQRVHQILNEGK